MELWGSVVVGFDAVGADVSEVLSFEEVWYCGREGKGFAEEYFGLEGAAGAVGGAPESFVEDVGDGVVSSDVGIEIASEASAELVDE